jgi:hypothetical protein
MALEMCHFLRLQASIAHNFFVDNITSTCLKYVLKHYKEYFRYKCYNESFVLSFNSHKQINR